MVGVSGDDLVTVLDIEVCTVAHRSIHTLRPHEGDELGQSEDQSSMVFRYGSKTVSGRTLPGRTVTIPNDKVVEVSVDHRLEPRIRPSAKLLRDREAAEAERLAKSLGVVP